MNAAELSRPASGHRPVMLNEMLGAIAPRDGAIYVDGTFGGGGYARALLDAADCRVWGIDRDPDAIAAGAALVERYAGRLTLAHGRHGDMAEILGAHGIAQVDGVALDVGVSSMQLDIAERGFSFRRDGPLDMRMDRTGSSAAEIVNDTDEGALADIIFRYGEERRSRLIARAIVEQRSKAPITRTAELAELVRRVLPRRKGIHAAAIDPATRTFQALRIYVNGEIEELARGLDAAEKLLSPGGRLAVVTFHSLEDRAVKTFVQERSGRSPRGSRHRPDTDDADRPATLRPLTRGIVWPTEAEITANPRARSARMRAAERTVAPLAAEGVRS